MRQINCYIPITVRVTGRPGDAQLDELAEALMRALAARIAFAEQTLIQGQSEGRLFGEAREVPDASRVFDGTYELPAYDRGGRLRRVPVRSTPHSPTSLELPLHSDFLNYAFFFTSDKYGRAAQDFIRAFYPQHRRFRARSFEHMFRLLLRDIRRHMRRTGRRAHVSEIVLVTHAITAGRIFIPLTEGRPRRTFTPSDLAELQEEFRRGLHRRFREERREVVGVLDESTQIVVRGCNVGQAQETLDALRLFFGGRPHVFAPTRFQHFRGIEIARSFAALEDAFDFLIDQGYLPEDQRDRPDEEKRRYIRETFGDWMPSEGFITTREEVEWVATLRGGRLTDEQRRRLEDILIRPAEQGGVVPGIPSAGEFWGHSGPRGPALLLRHDPELEALSAAELVAEARRLLDPYRAENAPRILRVLDALFSARAFSELIQAGMIDVNDPLAGLPDPSLYPHIFGDAPSLQTLETDAAGYPSDPFEEVTLPREEITAEQRAEEARQLATVRGLAAASVPTGPRETDYTARGRVETLPDGIRLWNFPVSRARLRAEFHDPLRQIAQQAISNPNLRIAVEGHASSSGSVRTNERLSRERALAVAQFLIDAGVPAGQIEAQGHGERDLLEREQGRHGQLIPRRMARNRRVEIRLLSQPTAPTAPAAPSPTEAELEAILRRLGPPPAGRPGTSRARRGPAAAAPSSSQARK